MTKAISIFSCANELHKRAIKRWRIAHAAPTGPAPMKVQLIGQLELKLKEHNNNEARDGNPIPFPPPCLSIQTSKTKPWLQEEPGSFEGTGSERKKLPAGSATGAIHSRG